MGINREKFNIAIAILELLSNKPLQVLDIGQKGHRY